MASINKVILVGHLGKSPDNRKLSNDISVTTFPLATTSTLKKDGKNIEETEWHNIVLWREMADAAARILDKGKLVYIEGKLQTRKFEKDGILKYTTEVIVSSFVLLGRNSDFDLSGDLHQRIDREMQTSG